MPFEEMLKWKQEGAYNDEPEETKTSLTEYIQVLNDETGEALKSIAQMPYLMKIVLLICSTMLLRGLEEYWQTGVLIVLVRGRIK